MGGSNIPGVYRRFLSLINVLQLDVFEIFDLDCFQNMDHLEKLYVETLLAIVALLLVLLVKAVPLLVRGHKTQAAAQSMHLVIAFFMILSWVLPNM